MINLSYNEVYNKIIRKIISIKWLQKWNINKHIIDSYIKSKNFTNELKIIIENNNFTAESTLNLCKPLLQKITNHKEPSDWLNYIYEYTLNKTFPETVTINLIEELGCPCEIYLRIFSVLCDSQKKSNDMSWQSLYPMNFLILEEENELEYPDEYRKFTKAFRDNYIYELMKINGELTGFTTLDHVCGVHYLSIYLAHQLKSISLPVKLGKVSGAAPGHHL